MIGIRNKSVQFCLLAVFYAVLGIVAFAALEFDRRSELSRATERAGRVSGIAAEYVRQIFASTNLGLATLAEDIAGGDHGTTDSQRALRERFLTAQRVSPAIQGIGFIGKSGRVEISATHDTSRSVDLSDRDYFIELRATPGSTLWIGAPTVTRPESIVSIPIARRVVDPSEDFMGVIAARIDPAYFARFFGAVGADAVAIAKLDGTVLARLPEVELVGLPRLTRDAGENRHSWIEERFESPLDGKQRIAAFRRVDSFPLIVEAGFDLDSVLASWRLRRNATAAVLAALAIASAALLHHRIRRREESEARRRVEGERLSAHIARLHAEAANQKKTEFLAHMSHELRTPLNAIIGFSEMIELQIAGPIGNKRYLEYAADVRFSASHLLAVVNNILDLARVEAGKWDAQEEDHPLDAIISDVLRLAKQRADREGVEIALALPDTPTVLHCDRRGIVQALLNVLVNAVRFAGEDRRVELRALKRSDGGLDIEVDDHGPGMSKEDAARAMRPFETGVSTHARKYQDTGLGLPLARAFTEMHGGELRLVSEVGRGTRAVMSLPGTRVRAA